MSYQPPFDWMSWDLKSLTEKDEPPPSVRNAVRLMYAGAAIEAVNAILLVAFIHSQFQSFFSQHQGDLATFPQVGSIFAAAHWTEASILSTIVVYAAIRIGMWLWMASKNHAGRRWARILSAVLLGLSTPALIADLSKGLRLHAVISRWGILEVAIWLVGVCAIALLWRQESSEFFTGRSKRQ
jgi:hypothetical protein